MRVFRTNSNPSKLYAASEPTSPADSELPVVAPALLEGLVAAGRPMTDAEVGDAFHAVAVLSADIAAGRKQLPAMQIAAAEEPAPPQGGPGSFVAVVPATSKLDLLAKLKNK